MLLWCIVKSSMDVWVMESKGKVISKIWINKSNKQKLCTVPAKSKLNVGDYVELKKI